MAEVRNRVEGLRGATSLSRVIGFWPLVFYGLGLIVGAGIYVAIGNVINRAGNGAPLSFLVAGLTGLFTGLCYAELAGRFPEAAGGASYVKRSFGSDLLAQLVGLATTVSVAISAASIASGAVRYLSQLIDLHNWILMTALVSIFTAIAASGIRASVGLAAAIGLVEIGGLIAAIATGFWNAPEVDFGQMLPTHASDFRGIAAGAFLGFFAFIGFETMANLGEEVRDPKRVLPRGILIAVAVSIILYVAVAAAAVSSRKVGDLSLLGLFEGRAASSFALVGAIAISNGVLIQIIMLARLFYGMSDKGQLPTIFSRVSAHTGTPVIATILAGAIILLTAWLMPFERLLISANALTLGIFVLVDLALWNVHRKKASQLTYFVAPAWVPPIAAGLAAALILSGLCL